MFFWKTWKRNRLDIRFYIKPFQARSLLHLSLSAPLFTIKWAWLQKTTTWLRLQSEWQSRKKHRSSRAPHAWMMQTCHRVCAVPHPHTYHRRVHLVRQKHHYWLRWEFQTHTKSQATSLVSDERKSPLLKDSWLLQVCILFQIVVFRQFSLFIRFKIDGSQSVGRRGVNKRLHRCWFIWARSKRQAQNKGPLLFTSASKTH